MTSGLVFWTSSISHSQNTVGLVCGLSTRNVFTPWWTQCMMMRFCSSQSARQSAVSQLTGCTSWYFLGGFSA